MLLYPHGFGSYHVSCLNESSIALRTLYFETNIKIVAIKSPS